MAASKFDEMTEGAADQTEYEEYVPRVVFTNDATPDLATLQISRLRLAQGMTPEVADRRASIGQYVLTNFPAVDEVDLVPLQAQNIRTYKPDAKAPPACQAPTGTFGIGNPGGPCNLCPLSKWGERNPKTGKSTPPPCKDGVVLRAYSITHRTIVDFQFMGRNTSKGTFLMTQALGVGYGKFVVRLKSSSAKNNLGQWFEPEIEMMGDVPEAHQEMAQRWHMAILEQTSKVSTADALKQLKESHTSG